jgi:hypothetical protein
MRRLAVASAVLAVLVGLGGCAHNSDANTGSRPAVSATAADPLTLCRQALPDRDVVSAEWTTVGDLRTWGYGGPVQQHPMGTAFPASGADDRAIWCWTREAADSYTAWGVHPPDGAARAIGIMGPTEMTPSGPPVIP